MHILKPRGEAGRFGGTTLPPPVSRAPIRITPTTVPFARWQRTRDRACAALLGGETRLLLTGPAGSGKSALLQEIGRSLAFLGWEVTIRLADASPVPEPAVAGGHSALLIDEVDRLPPSELARLLKTTRRPVLVAGLDTLGTNVKAGIHLTLASLSPDEAYDYVAQWLTLAGYGQGRLEPAALERMVELADGIPRVLSMLLGGSSWLADSFGVGVITREHVEDAAALRSCLPESEQDSEPNLAEVGLKHRLRARPYGASLLAIIALVAVGVAAATWTWPVQMQRSVALVRSYAATTADGTSIRHD